MVKSFKDKNIIICAFDDYHSMFIEDNGVLWTCGLSKIRRLRLHFNHKSFFAQVFSKI